MKRRRHAEADVEVARLKGAALLATVKIRKLRGLTFNDEESSPISHDWLEVRRAIGPAGSELI